MSALQLLTMLQLKRKLMAYSFIIYSWEFFDITSIYFDLLDYSNKLRGHMQTNTAQCSGLVQETILLTEGCQRPVFYKLHTTFCQDYFKKCCLYIVNISFYLSIKTPTNVRQSMRSLSQTILLKKQFFKKFGKVLRGMNDKGVIEQSVAETKVCQ